MKHHHTLTALIAALGVLSLAAARAEQPSKAGNPQFAMTSTFVDVGGVADCEDNDFDDVCDNSVAFITKTGHWGVRISGVDSNGVDPFRICLTGEHGAIVVAEGLTPVGPNNVITAGGDVYTDTGLDIVLLPGFGVMRDDATNPTGCWGHLLEFETGVRVY